MKTVYLFSDGACSGNPGPGGWGVLLRFGKHEKELSGGLPDTTNNQMELMAVIAGLEALTHPVNVEVYTDSRYVMDGTTKWMHAWKRNGWRTANKKAVKNKIFWQRLDTAMEPHTIKWHWVKGHSGHVENERVDELARMAIERLR